MFYTTQRVSEWTQEWLKNKVICIMVSKWGVPLLVLPLEGLLNHAVIFVKNNMNNSPGLFTQSLNKCTHVQTILTLPMLWVSHLTLIAAGAESLGAGGEVGQRLHNDGSAGSRARQIKWLSLSRYLPTTDFRQVTRSCWALISFSLICLLWRLRREFK